MSRFENQPPSSRTLLADHAMTVKQPQGMTFPSAMLMVARDYQIKEMLIVEDAATPDRRAARDLTFSVPASVNIISAMDGSDAGRLWKAIEQAQLSGLNVAQSRRPYGENKHE
jgi:hypothetical protein